MKKNILILLLFALAACSAHTIIVADVDLLSLAGAADELSGDITVPGNIQVYLPDADDNLLTPDGGYLIDGLPVLENIYGLGIELEVAVKNTGSGSLSFSTDFRLSAADDNLNIYDTIKDVSLAKDSLDLDPGDSGIIKLAATLEQGDANLSLISNDGFRVGVALAASGNTTAHYEITGFKVIAKQRPFELIPPP